MVGGKIINVVQLKNSTWIQCQDIRCQDVCAVRVEQNMDVKVGDSLWWQAGFVMWTPVPHTGKSDIKLIKLGYSHGNIPDDVMETIGL
jgi:hypothetical protein